MTAQLVATWNAHTRTWFPGKPEIATPIELYAPTEDGTEQLPPDANFDVAFHGEYDSLEWAIEAASEFCGRFMISTPADGHYTGYLNSYRGGVDVVTY